MILSFAEPGALMGLLCRTVRQVNIPALAVLAATSVKRRWITPKRQIVRWRISARRVLMLLTIAFCIFNLFGAVDSLTDAARAQDSRPENREPTPSSALANAEEKIARIRETANWRFVDKDFIETIEKRQSGFQGVAVTVLGVVRDEQNQPVEGAFVVLCLHSGEFPFQSSKPTENVFAVGWTDDKGVFEFRHQPTPWLEPTDPVFWRLCVFAPGYAIETREYRYFDDRVRNEEIQLQREQVIEGTIKDPDGKPISGIEVAHVQIVNPYDHANLDYAEIRTEMTYFISTDKQGKFRVGGLPPQRIATVISRLGARDMRPINVATSADLEPEKMIAKGSPHAGRVYPYVEPVFEIVTDRIVGEPAGTNPRSTKRTVQPLPTRTVTVRVVSAEDGEGVSGVAVGWERNVDEPRITPGMLVTNKQGTATLDISRDAAEIFIGGRRFGFVTHYRGFTTDPGEYTPTVERADCVKAISAGEQDLDVKFVLQPVPPLRITVQKEDGTAAQAELRISRHGDEGCQMLAMHTDEGGQASIAIRPVLFDIDITATTKDGLRGSHQMQLSKEFAALETATVVVK